MSRHLSSETTSFNVDTNLSDATELPTEDKHFLATGNRRRLQTKFFISIAFVGNQSIEQYFSIHKDSFSNPPTNRRLEEAVVGEWLKVMKFKAL
ncbi:hypothetical protein AVEN_74863-1 [Araneus ventricosus]|uniref:Uncharacterized protein n=1 Tax=Araneus ventricosus TaxID=182803 RepID=A0A4Y2TAN8_ARAVE|nr:hypothetical protein AVEN_119633-1 [Araneus ventricosus]GBN96782.1 hypothetical protein AVEN_29878-1 [Araneus ventricosus]GBN96843.1 hypothetical protein AVEN_257811-1 [Araneus ventricosus]GBN96846.1 hypothetical protein AVEN_74863-1 [Araneus ventricosus]